jgi:hypothetical protein
MTRDIGYRRTPGNDIKDWWCSKVQTAQELCLIIFNRPTAQAGGSVSLPPREEIARSSTSRFGSATAMLRARKLAFPVRLSPRRSLHAPHMGGDGSLEYKQRPLPSSPTQYGS